MRCGSGAERRADGIYRIVIGRRNVHVNTAYRLACHIDDAACRDLTVGQIDDLVVIGAQACVYRADSQDSSGLVADLDIIARPEGFGCQNHQRARDIGQCGLHRERNGKTGNAQNCQQRTGIHAERPCDEHDCNKNQNCLGCRAQKAENSVIQLGMGKQLVRRLQNQLDEHCAQNQQHRRIQQLFKRQLREKRLHLFFVNGSCVKNG